MSTVETVNRRFFCSYKDQVQVAVPEGQTVGQDELPLVIRFFKQIQSRSPIDDSVAVFERNLVGLKAFDLNYSNIKRLSSRTAYTTLFSDTLSSLGVPQVKQPDIIHKIFCLVDETAAPVLQVDIRICDITEYFSENNIRVDNDESILIDTMARESMETYRVRLRPATKSSIEGLEKLRLLDQSLELQAIVEHTPSCPICMEPLGCLDAEEDEEAMPKQKRKREEEETRPEKRRINGEGRPQDERNSNYEEEVEARPKKRTIKEEARPLDKRNCEENKEEEDARRQQLSKSNKKEAVDDDHPRMIMITRLPCLHHYHGDCIAHWLEINHVCPMCRYPMPVLPRHQNPTECLILVAFSVTSQSNGLESVRLCLVYAIYLRQCLLVALTKECFATFSDLLSLEDLWNQVVVIVRRRIQWIPILSSHN